MPLGFFSLNNLDLLTVGVFVAAICVLGFVVYFNNKKSTTNKTFFLFALITALWGLVNYFSYQFINPHILLWLFRFIMFFAVLQAFFLYRFLTVFPKENYTFSSKYKYFLIPIVILTALLTLTPYVFSDILGIPLIGKVAEVEKGPGLIIFALISVGLVVKAFHVLILKIKNNRNKTERKILITILTGLIAMFVLIIIFNFIFATVFSNPKFTPFGVLFTFPFIAFTTYAIFKQKLFSIKVVSTATFVFLLTIILFLEIIFADSLTLILFRSSVFFLVLVFGINLIRSVVKEVEQKEKLAKLNLDLNAVIKQRESLVHLVTHKVKGSFTRTKYLFAGMLDGTFGEVSPEIRRRAKQGLEFDNGGIQTVDLVLEASNLTSGSVRYDIKTIDLKDIVQKMFEEKKIPAETKGLKLELEIKNGQDSAYNILGDSNWIKEAINNLIENSIRYTKEGKIVVGLEKKDGKILFSVKDTGIGITDEDKKSLFTEGGRGQNSIKMNVDSTGYGLFSVKLIIEAHKGKVWAESEGEGKGSTFIFELPATQG